jgi:hypothetical protein
MEKWYVSKTVLNGLAIIMLIGFLAYVFQPSPLVKRLGLIFFLTAGTLVMVRGVIKITMGMEKRGRLPLQSKKRD